MTRFITRLATAILFLLIGAAALPVTAAQIEATQLDSLAVELWPDYDRPSMLVLITATLPEGTTLPATLAMPVPPDAEIHAVASFNETGALMSDVDYTAEDGRLTLTTPSTSFRIEYYTPYETNGNENTYSFEWLSDLSIGQMTIVVQQPIAATEFRTTPAAESSVANRGDGLTYHTLPARPVGVGEPVTVDIAYTVDAPVLSAPSQTVPGETATTSPAPESTTSTGSGFDPLWLLAIVAALALIAGAWYLGQRQGRSAPRPRKPQPTRPAKPTTSKTAAEKYCHNCGTPARAGDAFCRNCGTQLKSD